MICAAFVFSSTANASGAGTAGDPFTALSDAYTVPTGRYSFNLGSGTFEADVDNSEGGGWVLVLQYVHQGGTNPNLAVRAAGSDLPVTSAAALGTDESASLTAWGHAGNAAMSQFTGDIELRWYGDTSNHSRVIHFRTTLGDDYVRTGTGGFGGINPNFTVLTGHSANIPGTADLLFADQGDLALTEFPYFEGASKHWGIRGLGNRWEVDDFPNNASNDTRHRVWVRAVSPLEVTNTNDDGDNTLRQAITVANADTAKDNITFNISGAGPHVITPLSTLPTITDTGITIDGATQSGASCGTLVSGTQHNLQIMLDGNGSNVKALRVNADDVTIRGLSIVDFGGSAIGTTAGSSNLVIECNYFGLETDGVTAGGFTTPSNDGIVDINGVTSPIIRNNAIASGNDDLIRIDDSTTNASITGNIIGLDASGTINRGAGDAGIIIQTSSDAVIGGTTPTERNIISGNKDGIRIRVGATNTILLGNYIGTDINGNDTGVGNTNEGIEITDAATINNRVGDGTAEGANLIRGNGQEGIRMADSSKAAFLRNAIYGNGNLGIDLGNNFQVNINDSGDGDGGTNNLLNYPVFNGLTIATNGTDIDYDFNLDVPSDVNGYRIEFYKNTTPDPSGNGEGEIYLGFVDITHGGGDLNFTGTLTPIASVSGGDNISATATRKTASGGHNITSEFSANFAVSDPLVVTNTNDTGPGSLRAAIDYANANASADAITFNISGAGPHLINAATALPAITDAGISIDGSTQTGASCNDLWVGNGHNLQVQIDGQFDAPLITIAADNVTIRGLSVTGATLGVFSGTAQTGTTIECNYLGVTPAGAASTQFSGGISYRQSVFHTQTDLTVDQNVISNSLQHGLVIFDGGTNITVTNNFIGTDPTGTAAVANGLDSLLFWQGGFTVNTVSNNLISGNSRDGIILFNGAVVSGASGNALFQGNYIGVDRTGNVALGNGQRGIYIYSGSELREATFGGTGAGEGNIISGNGNDGIDGAGTVRDSTFLGNNFGVGLDGSTPLGNADNGAAFQNIFDTTFGNNTSAGRNVFADSGSKGLTFGNSTNVSVLGNHIGVDRTGNTDVGNGDTGLFFGGTGKTTTNALIDGNVVSGNGIGGIDISSGQFNNLSAAASIVVTNNQIGVGANGTTALGNTNFGLKNTNVPGSILVQSNTIANNGTDGIILTHLPDTNLAILSNNIYNNGQLGIDFVTGGNNNEGDGVTANDGGDADTGPNEMLNHPVVNTLTLAANNTDILYDFNLDVPSDGNGYRIEFFKNTAPDGSGHGEGEIYLGSFDVAHAGGDLNFTGTFTPSSSVVAGDSISATTTRKTATGHDITSEFAQNSTVQSPLVVTNTNDSGAGSLRAAIQYANSNASEDNITFNISGAGPHVISPSSQLPDITDPGVIIDALTQPGASCGALVTGTQHDLRIQLDGTNAGAESVGLTFRDSGSTLRGLSITNWDSHSVGIFTGADSFTAECLYVGVAPDGITKGPNAKWDNSASNFRVSNVTGANISNSLFSGNDDDAADDGIRFENATNASFTGNIVGLNAAGTAALGNGDAGILVDTNSSGITIGGKTAITRNIVSGNIGAGIAMSATSSTTLLGNYIGLARDGETDLGNTSTGVSIGSNSSAIALGDGTTEGRNFVSGNDASGIAVFSNSSVIVDTNNIGLSITDAAVGNSGRGFFIDGGATVEVTGNKIANNQNDAFEIEDTGTKVAIYANNIFANNGLAIDLEPSIGVNTNDSGDGDTGPNDLLNHPVLNTLTLAANNTDVLYDFNLDVPSDGNGYRIEFFKNTTPDGSGYGEGEIYLGSFDVAHAGGDLNFSGTFTPSSSVVAGDSISATATRKTATGYDITSEFAQNTTVQSPLIVTNTNDSGAGSLRAVIQYANDNASEDNITFNIPGVGPHTIAPLTALPALTDTGISIDGTTQSGASCGDLWAGTPHTLQIEISSSAAIFNVNADDILVKGVSITGSGLGFNAKATSNNATLQCSYVGLAPDGTAATGNLGSAGIVLEGNAAKIGGLVAGQGNVISDRKIALITVNGSTATSIQGNFLGTDPTGLAARTNFTRVINNQSGNSTWSDITKNLISGNTAVTIGAIMLEDDDSISGASGDISFAGNYFGVDRTGNAQLRNGGDALLMQAGSVTGLTIGGTNAEDRNIFSSGFDAIDLQSVTDITILGNSFGVGADGSTNVGVVGNAVRVQGSTNVVIGGTANGEGNIIANSGSAGIFADTTGPVTVLGNTISNSGGLGFDIAESGATGVNANDSGDGDTGTNDLLNYPVFNTVSPVSSGVDIIYDFNLDVPANGDGYRIEFFKNLTPDGSGHGEGEIYLGSFDVAHAGGDLNFTGTFTPASSVVAGDVISATATRKTATGYDITSEFAQNSTVQSSLVVTNTNDSGSGSLRAAIEFANNNTSEDEITFNISGAGPHVISPLSALPALTDTGISIDGTTQSGASCGDLWAGTPHTLQIEIDGSAVDNIFRVDGDDAVIRGLSLTGASVSAVNTGLLSDNAVFQCNYVGLKADGTADGNVEGLRLNGTGHIIGGATASDGNVISGNSSRNVFFSQTANTDHRVEGNFIGPFPTGLTAPSQGTGILNNHANNTVYNRNLISGNGGFGYASGPGASPVANTFTNNYFGTTITGNALLTNGNDALHFNIDGASFGNQLTIGTPGNGNVFATAAGRTAILVVNASNLKIQDNLIGVGADGTTDLSVGNHGIDLSAGASGALIGGDGPNEGNIIANTTANGLQIDAENVTILGNEIFNVAGTKEIDVSVVGEIAFPTVANAVASGDTSVVLQIEANVPAGNYRVEMFKVGVETGTEGDAKTYIGNFDITHGGSGAEIFDENFTSNIAIAAGDILTATLTEATAGGSPYGATSELARNGTAVSPLTVTNTNDSGAGSLRAAIEFANTNASSDDIVFDIPNAGPHTIALSSALPIITDSDVSIDGTTQSGASCGNLWAGTPHNVQIQIDGGGGAFTALQTSASDTLFKGLSVTNANVGVVFDAASTNGILQCSYIGLAPDGTASGHTNEAVQAAGASALIGGLTAGQGNVISGNGSGISTQGGSTATMIRGNFIGTDPTGLAARPNANLPVTNVNGAATWSDVTNNLISGNNSTFGDIGGIRIVGDDPVSGSSGDVLIRGNYIGVDRTGNTLLANGGDSISIASSGNSFTIGGTDPSHRNVLAFGEVDLRSSNITILGNYIGVGADGVTRMSPGGNTLHLRSSNNIVVGDGTPEGRNIIAGGGNMGVRLHAMTNVTLNGNYIGVGSDGTTDIGSAGIGISITNAGTSTITDNIIANMGSNGIQSNTAAGIGSAIIANRIFNNGGLGIDLNADGVTPNDSGDGDTGPNGLLNYPVFNGITADGSASLNYDFNLDVPDDSDGYRVDFFLNSQADPSGHGEGETWLGAIDIAHGGGDLNFTGVFTANQNVGVGEIISTTVTQKTATGFDATSEFSANETTGAPALSIDNAYDLALIAGTGTVVQTITVENTGSQALTNPVVTSAQTQGVGGLALASGPAYASGDTNGNNTIDIGEIWIYSASLTVTDAILNNGQNVISIASIETDQTALQSSVSVSVPITLTFPASAANRCVGTNLIGNGSFEDPGQALLPRRFTFVNNASIDDWAGGSGNVEIFNSGIAEFSQLTFSHTGAQHVELNSNGNQNLVSSTTVQPRAELAVFWAHRGRNGSDTASLVVTDNDSGSTNSGDFTTAPTAWSEQALIHVTGDGASTATLTFDPVSVGGGSALTGNLIDSVEVCQTYITLASSQGARTDVNASSSDSAGDTISYTFTVANPSGNHASLSSVEIVDDRLGTFAATPTSGDDGDGILEPGETWIVNQPYTFTQADVNAATYTNTHYVRGDTGNNVIRSSDQSQVVVLTPSKTVNLVKTGAFKTDLDSDGLADAGDVITYTYAVTNNGDVTITNVVVNDTHNGLGDAPNLTHQTLTDNGTLGDSTDTDGNPAVWESLAPGDIVTFTWDYTVVEDDVENLQ